MLLDGRWARGRSTAVRTVGMSLVLAIAGLGWAAVQPLTASACVRLAVDLTYALPRSNGAIYAARITEADYVDYAYDVTST